MVGRIKARVGFELTILVLRAWGRGLLSTDRAGAVNNAIGRWALGGVVNGA